MSLGILTALLVYEINRNAAGPLFQSRIPQRIPGTTVPGILIPKLLTGLEPVTC